MPPHYEHTSCCVQSSSNPFYWPLHGGSDWCDAWLTCKNPPTFPALWIPTHNALLQLPPPTTITTTHTPTPPHNVVPHCPPLSLSQHTSCLCSVQLFITLWTSSFSQVTPKKNCYLLQTEVNILVYKRVRHWSFLIIIDHVWIRCKQQGCTKLTFLPISNKLFCHLLPIQVEQYW